MGYYFQTDLYTLCEQIEIYKATSEQPRIQIKKSDLSIF